MVCIIVQAMQITRALLLFYAVVASSLSGSSELISIVYLWFFQDSSVDLLNETIKKGEIY